MPCDKLCPIVNLVGHKWKVLILRNLFNNGTQRFIELSKGINGISQKMLIQQLRQLEADGIIYRKVSGGTTKGRIFSYSAWKIFKTDFR